MERKREKREKKGERKGTGGTGPLFSKFRYPPLMLACMKKNICE